jgi:hypothetical protein
MLGGTVVGWAHGSGRPGGEGIEQGIEYREVVRAARNRNRDPPAAALSVYSVYSVNSDVSDVQVQMQVIEQSVHVGYNCRHRVGQVFHKIAVTLPPEEARDRPQLSQCEVRLQRIKWREPPCSSGKAGMPEPDPPSGELPDRLDLHIG